MGGAYRAINLKVSIITSTTTYTIGEVSALDIDIGYEGQPEPQYSSRNKSHNSGSKKISFSLSRWFYSDIQYEDLFLNLINDETEFTIKTNLIDKDGVNIPNTVIKLTGCKALNWKELSGGPEDVLGEQITGFGTDWDVSGFSTGTDERETEKVLLEGNYSSWSNVWMRDISADFSAMPEVISYNDENNVLIFNDPYVGTSGVLNLITGATIQIIIDNYAWGWDTDSSMSATGKYFVWIELYDTGTEDEYQNEIYGFKMHIFKDGLEIQEINLFTLFGWFKTINQTNIYFTACWSPDGKYILVTYSKTEETALFKGLDIGTEATSTVEASYTSWTKLWEKEGSELGLPNVGVQLITVYETANKVFLVTGNGDYCIVEVITGTLIKGNTYINQSYYTQNPQASVNQKYMVFYEEDPDVGFKFYKDGTVIQTVTLADLGWSIGGRKYTAITSNGKYVMISSFNNGKLALYKGNI